MLLGVSSLTVRCLWLNIPNVFMIKTHTVFHPVKLFRRLESGPQDRKSADLHPLN